MVNLIMSSENKRRKLVSVNLKVKLKAIDDIQDGVGISVIAANLGVHIATVRSWLRNEKKLRNWQDEYNDDIPTSAKRLRKPDNHLVDSALLTWFRDRRRSGCPVSGRSLQIQALHFYELLGGAKTFNASQGWLTKWQQRHYIKSMTISGEKLSVNVDCAEHYKRKFQQMINDENLLPEQIFSCDETGLNYHTMPKATLCEKSEPNATGFDGLRKRITVMACSNASGTCKLPLIVIGKFGEPRALKNSAKLPVSYKSQKSAWMISSLFDAWFYKEFVPAVKHFLQTSGLPSTAILFVNNCGVRPKDLEDDGIRVEFLPANTMSIIQPMDQGCLKALKMSYREHLMKYILDNVSNGTDLINTIKKVTIQEVIEWLADGWNNLPQSIIVKSWKPLWPNVEEIVNVANVQTQLSHDTLNELLNRFFQFISQQQQYTCLEMSSVMSWLNPLQSLAEDEMLDDNEIVDIVIKENEIELANEEKTIENDKMVINLCDKPLPQLQLYVEILIAHCQRSPHFTKDHIVGLISLQHALKNESLKTKY